MTSMAIARAQKILVTDCIRIPLCWKTPTSVIARDRAVVRRLAVRQVEHHLVDVAPAPAFRRIIALDDGMSGRVKMFRRVPVWRIVAAADMAATPANPQMQ